METGDGHNKISAETAALFHSEGRDRGYFEPPILPLPPAERDTDKQHTERGQTREGSSREIASKIWGLLLLVYFVEYKV